MDREAQKQRLGEPAGLTTVAVERRTSKGGRVRWRARYYDPTGKERAKVFDTKRAAEAYLAEQRASLQTQQWLDPKAGNVRLNQLWAQFATDRLPRRRPTTQQNYRAAWRNVAPALGDFPINRLRHNDVQRFVNDLDKGAETVRMAYRVLTLVIDYAVVNQLVRNNVARGVQLPAARPPRERILTGQQLLRLADAVGEAGRGQVLAMGLAGLRWSEMAALRASAIDLEARRIFVSEGAPEAGGKIHLGAPKSDHSIRRVGMPELLHADLTTRLQGLQPEDLVYPAPLGGLDRVGNFRRRVRWDLACREAGVGPATPHDLRRSFGSLARLGGADLRYIQKAMGHGSITTTSRIYAHLYDTEPDSVARGIDGALSIEQAAPDSAPVQAAGGARTTLS